LSSSSGADLLDELEQLLMGIAFLKEMAVRTEDYLVSFDREWVVVLAITFRVINCLALLISSAD